jgi:hypothetical protein
VRNILDRAIVIEKKVPVNHVQIGVAGPPEDNGTA